MNEIKQTKCKNFYLEERQNMDDFFSVILEFNK